MATRSTTDNDRPGSPTRTLMRGLAILKLLVDAHRPLSASEIGRHFALHQSSVSRILTTLATEGYVRRTSYRSYAPDYGLLGLGVAACQDFRLTTVPLPAMEKAAQQAEGLQVSLCLLWRDQMIYLMRTQEGQSPIPFSATGFPLHLSAPALRFAAEMPDKDALALFEASTRRYGWDRPTDQVPASPREALLEARRRLQHDCVVIEGWVMEGHVGGAINVRDRAETYPLAIALTGPAAGVSVDQLVIRLHEARRLVESSLTE